jgi:hypothetical protein
VTLLILAFAAAHAGDLNCKDVVAENFSRCCRLIRTGSTAIATALAANSEISRAVIVGHTDKILFFVNFLSFLP